MDQDNVITAFVGHLKDLGYSVKLVDRWPDKENRSSKDIDAIAGNFAIEHTSVDAMDDLRQRNDWFMKAAGNLESELNSKMQFRLRINIDYEAIDTGQNWKDIKRLLKDWILNDSPLLSEGTHQISITGIPFVLRVEKRSNEPSGLFFSRSIDKTKETLEHSVGPLIIRKAEKLAPYTQKGMTGVLLIQTEDLALMNHIRFTQAVMASFPNALPEGVSAIWYADASIPNALEFRDINALIERIKEQDPEE